MKRGWAQIYAAWFCIILEAFWQHRILGVELSQIEGKIVTILGENRLFPLFCRIMSGLTFMLFLNSPLEKSAT